MHTQRSNALIAEVCRIVQQSFRLMLFKDFLQEKQEELSFIVGTCFSLCLRSFLSSQPESMTNVSFQTHVHPLERVETQLQVWWLYSLARHLLANEPTVSSHCPLIIACCFFFLKKAKSPCENVCYIFTQRTVSCTECADDPIPACQMLKI